MHGEREAKTEDDDHSSLIGGVLRAGLVDVINRVLSEAPGTKGPHRPSQDRRQQAMERTRVWELYLYFP